MYREKNRGEEMLFKELMPFGGKLEGGNRWMKIKGLIPWEELEKEYGKHFAKCGRPGLDGKLVIGLFLLKHMSGKSDREVIRELLENVYWQAFCSFEGFVTSEQLNSSSLSRIRKRLGKEFTKVMEEKTYGVLIERKIIRAKGMLVDGTVIPEKIKYPNDITLLNDVREWTVKWIKKIAKQSREEIRTRCRQARKVYLNFAKKKQKSQKLIDKTKKQMLQFLRRNIEQLRERAGQLEFAVAIGVKKRLETARKIYEQQRFMYREGIHSVEHRIVSWWKEYVRPIKRGKGGKKEVEFGPKISISYVDGFSFVDEMNHENYSEAKTEIVKKQIEHYEERFGRKPPSMTGDQLYGNRENRKLLDELGIRSAFKPLGRKTQLSQKQERYMKRKQRERNRIEGDIGHVKEHYGGHGIRYHDVLGSELWIRFGFLAKNLRLAALRA